jgi:hypothetical protein
MSFKSLGFFPSWVCPVVGTASTGCGDYGTYVYGSGTNHPIGFTLSELMKIFWQTKSISVSASCTGLFTNNYFNKGEYGFYSSFQSSCSGGGSQSGYYISRTTASEIEGSMTPPFPITKMVDLVCSSCLPAYPDVCYSNLGIAWNTKFSQTYSLVEYSCGGGTYDYSYTNPTGTTSGGLYFDSILVNHPLNTPEDWTTATFYPEISVGLSTACSGAGNTNRCSFDLHFVSACGSGGGYDGPDSCDECGNYIGVSHEALGVATIFSKTTPLYTTTLQESTFNPCDACNAGHCYGDCSGYQGIWSDQSVSFTVAGTYGLPNI